MAHTVRIHEHGGPEVLRYEEVEPESPGPGEALIEQSSVGVNFIDTYHRSGLYPVPDLPAGIGSEAAGIVQHTGPGVEAVQEGDRVAYAFGTPGAYATHRVIPADRLVKLPGLISEQQAAGMMLKGMTAEYLIRRAFRVQEGMDVLFHAAAGGVGLIACQWLKAIGARVIGTVGSQEKSRLAKEHGCDDVIRYDEEDFVARVHELTDGKGVRVVFDGVGKATWEGSLDSLQPRGTMVSFGNASGEVPPFKPLTLSHKGSLFLTRPKLFDYTATRQELLESAHALFMVVESRQVKIEVNQTYPLSEAAQAHRDLESRRLTGSTVLLPEA